MPEEQQKSLESRLRLLEDILGIPQQTELCCSEEGICSAMEGGPGCIRDGTDTFCPRIDNKLTKLLAAVSAAIDDSEWMKFSLHELKDRGFIPAEVLRLATVKVALRRARQNLKSRKMKLTRFNKLKKASNLESVTLPMRILVQETEKEVEILQSEEELLTAVLEGKQAARLSAISG